MFPSLRAEELHKCSELFYKGSLSVSPSTYPVTCTRVRPGMAVPYSVISQYYFIVSLQMVQALAFGELSVGPCVP